MFKNGYDVDSYVDQGTGINWIYINNFQRHLDVYQVTIADSDGDGKVDPNQHPKNPKDTGPIEKRTLKYIKTYTNVTLGGPGSGEVYAVKDGVYFLQHDGVYKFTFQSGQTKHVIKATSSYPVIGFDDLNNRWYAGNSGQRRVYGLCAGQNAWHLEFAYPSMAGSHMDGMEVVVDPNENIPYVYVSDMTSDFIAQYYQDKKNHEWKQKNVFKYQDNGAGVVEGMGFGAFNHFWATGGNTLYELGGGSLQNYVEPS